MILCSNVGTGALSILQKDDPVLPWGFMLCWYLVCEAQTGRGYFYALERPVDPLSYIVALSLCHNDLATV